jgi:hypothetical protein
VNGVTVGFINLSYIYSVDILPTIGWLMGDIVRLIPKIIPLKWPAVQRYQCRWGRCTEDKKIKVSAWSSSKDPVEIQSYNLYAALVHLRISRVIIWLVQGIFLVTSSSSRYCQSFSLSPLNGISGVRGIIYRMKERQRGASSSTIGH